MKIRRLAAAVLLTAAVLPADDSIEALGHRWTVPIGADWKVTPYGVLDLLVGRPSTAPRRPSQYALAETAPYSKLEVDLEVRAESSKVRNRFSNSLILVYAWRGPNHFNYVHLSLHTAAKQPVHNGIFHVYGGDRVRISGTEGPATLKDEVWHKVKFRYSADSGRADVWVDGVTSPSMRAVDMSLSEGRFGLGSFFDTGSFRNLKILGVSRSSMREKTR
ncbi:MAG: hypothetical protein FJW31_22435 [Acidobacteria bacterium]|nr:hypothetical protein [Acidobacteriota bacterium]